ncbi:response regulator [Roseomonas elaeocarpi]|uniref:Response regulator n=1 Tax=Roseomonas elaeocarpi TaxID=907779 RepID=A0ABV6JUX7_9PROT
MCDVLVVDDDDLVRMTLSSVLEMEGWDVREAGSPQEALRAGEMGAHCHLLVTDIDLGTEENGFDLAARLRRVHPEVPVVYVSGRPWLFDGRVMGADERSLAKPFRTEDLTRMVRELLQGRC